MAKFVVSVEEKLCRSFIVEAESSLAAKYRLFDAYFNGNISLNAEDNWLHAEIETEWEAEDDDLEYYENLDDIL